MKRASQKNGPVFGDLGKGIFAIAFILFLLAMSSLAVNALPAIELNTTVNDNVFYTLPLMGTTTLEHVVNTTDNGTPLVASVQVDFVRGISHRIWWDTSYKYRMPLSFTLPSTFNTNYSVVLKIDLSAAVDTGKLRNDFADVRLIENDLIVPFFIENEDPGNFTIVFRVQNETLSRSMDLYYGKPTETSLANDISAYRFKEEFNDLDRWNVYKGSFSIAAGRLDSGYNETSGILLENITGSYDNKTHTTDKKPFIMSYRLRLEDNSTSTIMLSESLSATNKSLNITFNEYSDKHKLCYYGTCINYTHEMESGTWYNITLEASSSTMNIDVSEERLASIPYNLGEVYIRLEATNTTRIDDFSILRKLGLITAVTSSEQELIQSYSTQTFGGVFGWTHDITGMDTGTYSIRTEVQKTNYEPNATLDTITMYYKKIAIDIYETGLVTQIEDRYVADVTGTIKFTNPNFRNVSIDVLYNTDLTLIDLYGDHFTGNSIRFTPLGADSDYTIQYYIAGISYTNPIYNDQSVLGSAISRAGGLSDYYEFNQNSITKTKKVKAPEEQKESGVMVVTKKKGVTFTLEGLAQTYGGLPLVVTKSISSKIVRPGDIVDVSIKVDNVDVVSRIVTITDIVPKEFIYIKGFNKPQADRRIIWNYDLNKMSSKVATYRLMYVGNSTGAKLIDSAQVSFEVYNMTSNNITIFRDQARKTTVYSQKNIMYLPNNKARVTITLVNTGDFTVDELYVAEFIGPNEFSQESKRTPFKGEWIIKDFRPGRTWTVSYLTTDHEMIENDPKVFSYEQNVLLDSALIIDNDKLSARPVWKETRSHIVLITIILILVAEILASLYYFFVSVEFYAADLEELTFKTLSAKIWRDFRNMIANLPRRAVLTVYLVRNIITYGIQNVIIFFKILRIWISNKVPLLWSITDKLRELDKYEWFLFLKMLVDYAKRKVLDVYEYVMKYIRPITDDIKKRHKKEILRRQGLDDEETKRLAEIEKRMTEKDVITEKETLEMYEESQKKLEELKKNMEK